MSWVNVGATVSGERPASKAALKRALAADPALVQFDPTGLLGSRALSVAIDATVEDIGENKLSVVGPDPYEDRRWYATVEVKNGKLRIS
jgi:hypothetical protein